MSAAGERIRKLSQEITLGTNVISTIELDYCQKAFTCKADDTAWNQLCEMLGSSWLLCVSCTYRICYDLLFSSTTIRRFFGLMLQQKYVKFFTALDFVISDRFEARAAIG